MSTDHAHHGIECDLPVSSIWCEAIDAALVRISERSSSHYEFLCKHLARFCALPDSFEREIIDKMRAGVKEIYAPTATFALYPRTTSAGQDLADVELTATQARIPKDALKRVCTVAHELAHAYDVLDTLDRTGDIPRRTRRADEEVADSLVAEWGFECAGREEMKPGGWYDRPQ